MSDNLKKKEGKEKEQTKKNNLPVIIGSVVGVIALAIILFVYVFTGNKTLTCTKTVDQSSLKIDTEFKVNFKMNNADSVDATFNIILDDKYLDYKDTFIEKFKQEYSTYEKKYDIKPKYEETDKGLKMTFTATNNSFQKLMSISNSANSYKNVKSDLEKDQYKCK